MATQKLHCETVTLGRIEPTPVGICPGVSVLLVAPVVVDIPVLTYAVIQHWTTEQLLRLSNVFLSMPDLRGPPPESSVYNSCRGSQPCGPQYIHTTTGIDPIRGVYAS